MIGNPEQNARHQKQNINVILFLKYVSRHPETPIGTFIPVPRSDLFTGSRSGRKPGQFWIGPENAAVS